jgi:hypothetical protein
MDKERKQWIILCVFLLIVLLIFMILWIVCLNEKSTTINIQYSAEYGLYPNTDGVVLNKCGPNSNQPCSFTLTSLSDCITQCSTILSSICKGFVFIPGSNLMKIIDIDKNQTSSSQSAYLYIKQNIN